MKLPRCNLVKTNKPLALLFLLGLMSLLMILVFSIYYFYSKSNPVSPVFSPDEPPVYSSLYNLPLYPGLVSYTPENKIKNVEYLKLEGENKLSAIQEWYLDWLDKKGVKYNLTQNMDETWVICLQEKHGDNYPEITAQYSKTKNVVAIR